MNACTSRRIGRARCTALAGLTFLIAGVGCDFVGRSKDVQTWGPLALPPLDQLSPPPSPSDATFPCSDCHDPDIPVNHRVREMKAAHAEIEFQHGKAKLWCLDCHDALDRDQLKAAGRLVPFDTGYRVCGQCHAGKFREWVAGEHGERVDTPDGTGAMLQCVHCHDSHHPAPHPPLDVRAAD